MVALERRLRPGRSAQGVILVPVFVEMGDLGTRACPFHNPPMVTGQTGAVSLVRHRNLSFDGFIRGSGRHGNLGPLFRSVQGIQSFVFGIAESEALIKHAQRRRRGLKV